MARINIEDTFWVEVGALIGALGDQDRAVGMAIRFFRVAQENHKAGRLVSEQEFGRSFDERMIGIFAERVEGGIQAIGAQKHFGWLRKKVEAGRKGGSTSKQTKAKRSKTIKSEQTEPSPSSSSSFSDSTSDSRSIPPEGANESPVKGNAVVGAYYREWGKRYPGERPVLLPQHHKFLKTLGDQEGEGRAVRYVEAYLAMPDNWFLQKRHDVETLKQNLNAVSHFISSGKVVTAKVLQHAEDLVDKAQGTNRRPRKSVEELARERDPNYVPGEQQKLVSGGEQ